MMSGRLGIPAFAFAYPVHCLGLAGFGYSQQSAHHTFLPEPAKRLRLDRPTQSVEAARALRGVVSITVVRMHNGMLPSGGSDKPFIVANSERGGD